MGMHWGVKVIHGWKIDYISDDLNLLPDYEDFILEYDQKPGTPAYLIDDYSNSCYFGILIADVSEPEEVNYSFDSGILSTHFKFDITSKLYPKVWTELGTPRIHVFSTYE